MVSTIAEAGVALALRGISIPTSGSSSCNHWSEYLLIGSSLLSVVTGIALAVLSVYAAAIICGILALAQFIVWRAMRQFVVLKSIEDVTKKLSQQVVIMNQELDALTEAQKKIQEADRSISHTTIRLATISDTLKDQKVLAEAVIQSGDQLVKNGATAQTAGTTLTIIEEKIADSSARITSAASDLKDEVTEAHHLLLDVGADLLSPPGQPSPMHKATKELHAVSGQVETTNTLLRQQSTAIEKLEDTVETAATEIEQTIAGPLAKVGDALEVLGKQQTEAIHTEENMLKEMRAMNKNLQTLIQQRQSQGS